jgi:hypothetical protein
MIVLAAALLAGSLAATPPAWHDLLAWRGQSAAMTAQAGGAYTLRGPFGERAIPAPARNVQTASPLFDGLFAMAQDDLRLDSVESIRDAAFDHDQPMPCHCFETGAKWHYVWTRDLSYSVDLGLWRFDAARSRNGLLFKLSGVRAKDVPQGLYPMQDTGSGGSWPISTDRVVWFLAARHLLGDKAFAGKVWTALVDTLAQDREYAFDPHMGLYRGETSFLDWREQSYPEWTQANVAWIAQSFALSTNVLHYEALHLAAAMAARRHDPRATQYAAQADALKQAINAHFWRTDRDMYMSYIGGDGQPVEAYDLLGISLAITSGVADQARARASLAHYPAWPAGSPVIWPERADQPIYHNRAIWPFVSAYALRAARMVNDPERIAHELRSLLRGAALSGSNMENFELLSQRVHVEDGKLSGPVVNSPRQLWSVGGYLDMVIEGVFGLGADGRIAPKLPASLLPRLFGSHERISLQLRDQRITLQRPASVNGNLLVAGDVEQHGNETVVTLKAIHVDTTPQRLDAPLFAPATPAAPQATRAGSSWKISFSGYGQLYVDGKVIGAIDGQRLVPASTAQQCFFVTRRAGELESLPSPATCVGPVQRLAGAWPRTWTAPASGRFQATLVYANDHGPINTGITAAVKNLVIACKGAPVQTRPLVMPHSVGMQPSTDVTFYASAGAHCTFSISQGFNMSFLRRFAHYTGGQGGIEGSLNEARIGDLLVTPLTRATP